MTFLDSPSDELRQGDILFEWPFPVWNLNTYQISSEWGTSSPRSGVVNLMRSGEPLPVIICSHDCEVENSRSRQGLLVAPVVGWPFAPDSDETVALVESRTPDSSAAYDYINWFPVDLRVDGTHDWRIVEFSAISPMSPPNKIKNKLLAAKRFEMTDDSRQQFKEKLAMFFGR